MKISDKKLKQIGDELGIDWSKIPFEQLKKGIQIELEHGKRDPQTDVTHDDPIKTIKVAWAHLKERPDYYTILKKVEESYSPFKKYIQKRKI
jgi:hypothetical protein